MSLSPQSPVSASSTNYNDPQADKSSQSYPLQLHDWFVITHPYSKPSTVQSKSVNFCYFYIVNITVKKGKGYLSRRERQRKWSLQENWFYVIFTSCNLFLEAILALIEEYLYSCNLHQCVSATPGIKLQAFERTVIYDTLILYKACGT